MITYGPTDSVLNEHMIAVTGVGLDSVVKSLWSGTSGAGNLVCICDLSHARATPETPRCLASLHSSSPCPSFAPEISQPKAMSTACLVEVHMSDL